MNLIDLLITTIWVDQFGLGIEANPIAKWMYSNNSIYVFKTIGILLFLIVLEKALQKAKSWKWTAWLLFGAYGALTVYHLIIVFKVISVFSGVI